MFNILCNIVSRSVSWVTYKLYKGKSMVPGQSITVVYSYYNSGRICHFYDDCKKLHGLKLTGLNLYVHRCVWKHVRGLSMCIFLLLFPGFMAFKMSQFFHMDFWLLILVSSCMLTSLQV